MVVNQFAKNYETFHLGQFAIILCGIFKDIFRYIYENTALNNYWHITTITHSSQIKQKLVQKRKIAQSSSPVQCSISVVHSTICTYPASYVAICISCMSGSKEQNIMIFGMFTFFIDTMFLYVGFRFSFYIRDCLCENRP